jgi:hypothetical protein
MLLLGYGAIARRLVELVQPFGMTITAVRRRPTGDEAVRTIGEDEVEDALRNADHVVNTLPEGAATKHFMNAARFAAMKPGAIFYNVGRGSTVDQEALLEHSSRNSSEPHTSTSPSRNRCRLNTLCGLRRGVTSHRTLRVATATSMSVSSRTSSRT